MIKYLLCVLSILVMFSSVGLGKEGFIFFYDFNNEQVGKPPSDPWKSTAAGKIEVVNFPSVNNKSVKITDSGSGAGMTLILDSVLKNKIVSMEFKWFREESDNTGVEICYAMNQKCPDDWSGVCVKMELGSYHYNDSDNWVAGNRIVDNEWHDIKYVIYLNNNKYDFYWNGKQIAKNAGFRKSEGIEGVDKFNMANVGDGNSSFIMYFDDIMLYEGTNRPFSVNPEFKLAVTWGTIKSSFSKDSHREYPGGHKGTRFEKGLASGSEFI